MQEENLKIFKAYYESDSGPNYLRVIGTVDIENREQGVSIYFYKTGKLEVKANYKDDKLNGISEHFYESGKLKARQIYKDGKLNGLQEEYYENGNQKMKANYKDDKLNGVLVEYYENGNPKMKARFKDGKLNGLLVEYYINANQIKRKAKYEDGVLISTEYYKIDTVKIELSNQRKIESYTKQIDPERRKKVKQIMRLRKDEEFNTLKEGKKFKEAYARFEALKSQKQQKSKVR